MAPGESTDFTPTQEGFKLEIKIGHPGGMFLVNCIRDYCEFEFMNYAKLGIHRIPGHPAF